MLPDTDTPHPSGSRAGLRQLAQDAEGLRRSLHRSLAPHAVTLTREEREDIAELLGCSHQQVSKMLSGHAAQSPKAWMLPAIVAYLEDEGPLRVLVEALGFDLVRKPEAHPDVCVLRGSMGLGATVGELHRLVLDATDVASEAGPAVSPLEARRALAVLDKLEPATRDLRARLEQLAGEAPVRLAA